MSEIGVERQPANVRRAALEILVEAQSGPCFVDEVLARKLPLFEVRDRHLLQEICFGAVRHQNTLDHLLRKHLKLSAAKQRPPIAWALRIGVYQIVYLGRIPAHAAVNQTLEGLKQIEGTGKRDIGFVNAVLHKTVKDVVRKSNEPPQDPDDVATIPIRRGFCHFGRPLLPLARMQLVDHLAIKHSHPKWLVRRWVERLGDEETKKLLASNNVVASTWARVTARAPSRDALLERLREEGVEAEAAEVSGSIALLGGGDFRQSGALTDGWMQIQDLTASRIGRVLDPPAVSSVLDLCSAPGGKSVQMLEKLGEGSTLVATDRAQEKLERVSANLAKVGSDAMFRVVLVPEDPAEIDLGERFTHVLVDAPCSNTGVLARRPDARWRVTTTDINSLVELQGALLEAGLRHLEPGGRLVYATCSIEPAENEERVAQLMKDHPDLSEIETKLFLPHRSDGDGGFYSLLRKGL